MEKEATERSKLFVLRKTSSHKFTVTHLATCLHWESSQYSMHSIQAICVKSIKMSAHTQFWSDQNPYRIQNQFNNHFHSWNDDWRRRIATPCNRLRCAHFQRFAAEKIDGTPFIMHTFKYESILCEFAASVFLFVLFKLKLKLKLKSSDLPARFCNYHFRS